MIFVIILGIGYIGIQLQHRKKIYVKNKKIIVIILKCMFGMVGIIILFATVDVVGCRNINYIKHYSMVKNGVDEGVYLNVGGMEQYILMRGADKTIQ